MAEKAPLLDETAIQTLLRTAQGPTALADTATAQWPDRLAHRLKWLSLWDSTLAPLLVPTERSNEPFDLKPQRVNELLQAWSLGLPSDTNQATPNSAALLLQAHKSAVGLLPAIAAWGQEAVANPEVVQRHLRSDEAQTIKAWLQRWERKEAELAMLQQIKALDSLSPLDQERLSKLGGEAYKSQLMQVDPDALRIILRDRVDSHSLERYFRDDAQASETVLAIRAKAVNPASERLQIGQWNAESFFDTIRLATSRSVLLGQSFTLDVRRVTLVSGDIQDASDACIFTHRSVELKLLLTISVQGGVAIMQLALLVPCDGLRVSDYCTKLLRISDSVESTPEKLARGEIVEKVLQEALGVLKARGSAAGGNSPVNFAG